MCWCLCKWILNVKNHCFQPGIFFLPGKSESDGDLMNLLNKAVKATLNKYKKFYTTFVHCLPPYEVANSFGVFIIFLNKKNKINKRGKKRTGIGWVKTFDRYRISQWELSLIQVESKKNKDDSRPEGLLGNFMHRSVVYPTVCPTGRTKLPQQKSTNPKLNKSNNKNKTKKIYLW